MDRLSDEEKIQNVNESRNNIGLPIRPFFPSRFSTTPFIHFGTSTRISFGNIEEHNEINPGKLYVKEKVERREMLGFDEIKKSPKGLSNLNTSGER
jgi:hypothetical protein